MFAPSRVLGQAPLDRLPNFFAVAVNWGVDSERINPSRSGGDHLCLFFKCLSQSYNLLKSL